MEYKDSGAYIVRTDQHTHCGDASAYVRSPSASPLIPLRALRHYYNPGSPLNPPVTSVTRYPRSAASHTACCTHWSVTHPATTSCFLPMLRSTYASTVLLNTLEEVFGSTISSLVGLRLSITWGSTCKWRCKQVKNRGPTSYCCQEPVGAACPNACGLCSRQSPLRVKGCEGARQNKHMFHCSHCWSHGCPHGMLHSHVWLSPLPPAWSSTVYAYLKRCSCL